MDTDTSTVEGKYRYQDGTSSSFTLDASCVTDKLQYQNNLLVFTDILLFAILIFLAFQLALRGFYKIGK